MDPQRRPPPPLPATYTHHSQLHSPRSPNTSPDDCEHVDQGQDACERQQQNPGTGHAPKSANGRARDSVISHPFSPNASSPPSPSSSLSSAARLSHHRSLQEIQPSSPAIGNHCIASPPPALLDPEKHGRGSSQGRPSPDGVASGPDAPGILYDQGEYHEKAPEEKAWQLLFYLSGPCALLSMFITLWTFVALLISLLSAPLRFCTTRPCLSEQLTTLLAPALNTQLHLVYSHNSVTDYSAPMLVVIHVFSPVVAFGVAIASWTAAAFWIFTSILGDPGGNDGHNDGKESILGVRNWWERWLSRALRVTID